jgi:3-isopropylmalate/(R)-2-methylmalate dehydratase small subunit
MGAAGFRHPLRDLDLVRRHLLQQLLQDLDKLFDDAERGANATLSIDLAAQEIRGPDGGTVKFEIDPFRKHCLMNGLDDIGLTMEKKASIDAYEEKARTARAWA